MLGYDFLTQNNCLWDFGGSKIQILGKWCTPFSKNGTSKCRRLYVASDVVIPAKHQINLPVRAIISSLKEGDSIFMTNPKSIQKGVYLGSTMLPTALHEISVRAVNTSNEPRMVKRDLPRGVITCLRIH